MKLRKFLKHLRQFISIDLMKLRKFLKHLRQFISIDVFLMKLDEAKKILKTSTTVY